MEQSTTRSLDPQGFIAAYIEAAWVHHHRGEGDDMKIRERLGHACGEFPIAFRVAFGRVPTERELDLLSLAREESLYWWVRGRRRSETGQPIDSPGPGGLLALKLRRKLGLPGGVRNRREYDELLLLVRETRRRVRARVQGRLDRPLGEEEELTVDRIVDLELDRPGPWRPEETE